MADYESREIYEIKSVSKIANAAWELTTYLAALNRAPGQTHEWVEGSTDYIFPGNPIITDDGNLVVVFPPIYGLILYRFIDLNLTTNVLLTGALGYNIKLLINEIIAAAARNASFGF
ncbi:MAG: hypothetical protein F6K45_21015 [Kamptonema sp. SIO1D9]|nr:hypothetical protein [Kamptonema sp. SIO1D9]